MAKITRIPLQCKLNKTVKKSLGCKTGTLKEDKFSVQSKGLFDTQFKNSPKNITSVPYNNVQKELLVFLVNQDLVRNKDCKTAFRLFLWFL